MANIADSIEDILREELSPASDEALFEADPLFEEILKTSVGVVRDDVGRDWSKKQTFVTSLAGAIKAEAATGMEGDTLTFGGSDTEPSTIYSPVAGWPSVGQTPSPGYAQKTISLKRWRGNLFLPLDLFRADQLNASIISAVGTTLKQTCRNVAMQRANNFTASDGVKLLGLVGASPKNDAGDAVDDEDRECVVTLEATTQIRRFAPGMMVEIRNDADGTLRNDGTYPNVIITKVDPIGGTIRVTHVSSSGTWATAPAADDYIVLANSFTAAATGHGPTGLLQWITNSGTPYGISLTNFPQFKSKITAISATLTDQLLKAHLGAFQDTHNRDQWPETLIVTPGVLSDYNQEVVTYRNYESQNQPIRRHGGFDSGARFSFDGWEYRFATSNIIPKGYVIACKMRNGNIQRLVPPNLPGSGSQEEFPQDVEFIAPALGFPRPWMHTTSSDQLTPYVQAPFEIIEEYVPEVIPGVILTGATEYSTS